MRAFSTLISALLLCAVTHASAQQSLLPQADGDKVRLSALIEMPNGYLSGICVLMMRQETIRGCIFNEFGLTALDFTYDTKKDKVKIDKAMAMFNKWHIKRTLKNDLKKVFHNLSHGTTGYRNEKRQITYQFKPIKEDDAQE